MCPESLQALIAVHKTKGIGTSTISKLLSVFKQPQDILDASHSSLQQVGLSTIQVNALQQQSLSIADDDMEWLEASDRHHIITLEDEHYPLLLKQISDPPYLLYVNGDHKLLNDPQLAVVGTRNPSKVAVSTTKSFSSYLSRQGLCITSGLALGIDASSHKGALEASGPTIAVIATGQDRVYPSRHRELAHQIAEQGAIVSEFPIGTAVHPKYFPRRNRLISGMSIGVLVVEAALKSGSLITARLAVEQGREVFAIPGSIHNPMARGCHQLIKEGAKLIETAEDILEELQSLIGLTSYVNRKNSELTRKSRAISVINHDNLNQNAPPMFTYTKEHESILSVIGHEPISIDQMVVETGMAANIIASMLLILELDGIIAACGGGYYKCVA